MQSSDAAMELLESLKRSDERYRAFLKSSSQAIWRFELDEPIPLSAPVDEQVTRALRDGWLAECNDAMARMYGYETADQLVGARLTDLLIAEDANNIAYLRAFFASGCRLEEIETHERDRAGNDKYFINTLTGIVEDGRLLRAWGTQRDITERTVVERRRESEGREMQGALERLNDLQRRLTDLTGASGHLLESIEKGNLPAALVRVARTLVESDGAAVWMLETGMWEVAAQEGLSESYTREMLGEGSPVQFDEPREIGEAAFDTLPPALKEAYGREGIRSMLVVPLRIRERNTGALVFYQRHSRPFGDVELKVASALGSMASSGLHISQLYAERAAAAQRGAFLARAGALLSSSLNLKHTLTQVATLAVPHIADWCAVDLVSDDGVIEPLVLAHVNPEKVQWAESLRDRYPADQSGSSGASRVIRTGEPQIIPIVTADMIEAGARDEEHLRILNEMAIRSVIIVPMIARGRTVGAITFVSTAESSRTFDDDDMTLAQQLASRAAMAAENARLYEQAQDANRLKDEFFATLSHELRTPINAVLGWAQLLIEGDLAGDAHDRAVQAIVRNARAQARLLNDILEMSRIVSGKMSLTMEEIDLSAMTHELIDSMRPTFDAKRQSIDEELSPALIVRADRARLQQVIFNLLSNAAKFTPPGGRIALETAREGDGIELRVRDNGAGISGDFLPHVFERFRQGDSSATRAHGGLGIGLAVARHLVELHGGTIRAESAGVDQGATFTVRLPAPQAAA